MNATELSAELLASQHRLASWSDGTSLAANIARLVGRVGTRLSRPPRVVLLGEFNSGKSTLANVLLGSGVLPTSIHANTRVPILIRYAETPTLEVEFSGGMRHAISMTAAQDVSRGSARMLHLGLPLVQLKTFELIDTPGFAEGRHVKDFCLDACRRSHVAVWCTSALQAWKATEVSTWAAVPQRLRRNSVLVVSHKDVLNAERDEARIRARLEMETKGQFRKIVLVSGLEAEHVRPGSAGFDDEAWRASGGASLHSALQESVEIEMKSRIGSAERILARAATRFSCPASERAAAQVAAA